MGFNTTAQDPKIVEVIGSFAPVATGVVALSGGTAEVTVSNFESIDVALVHAHTANATRVTDITGNTFTITGTGTDVVMYLAVGKARL